MRITSSRSLRLIFALCLLSLAAPAAADAAKRKPAKLSVMTRNIYLGGDISKPIGTTSFSDFAAKNGEVWRNVRKTDFPARAKLLAKEIRSTKPDVIGLQEVALWRKSPDGASDGQQTASTIVVYDFLALLQAELRAVGMRYSLGHSQREIDVEGPTDEGYDVRLTMRDVILVRRQKGTKVTRRGGKNYVARLSVPTAVGPVNVIRGYGYVDLTHKKRKLRIVNTHLEAFLEDQRVAQAKELVARGGPTRVKRPVILTGDMNSDPNNADGASPVAYRTIRNAGFRDAWDTIKGRSNPGYACCMNREDIMDPPPAPFDHQIDHIFTKPRIGGTKAVIVGGNPNNRTATGLWPSDHGGWVAYFRLK
jgi:endonuclease/exonuclease/phosphatase family metal-dependent hydrolase